MYARNLPTFKVDHDGMYQFLYSQEDECPSFTVSFSHCYANDVVAHEPKITLWLEGQELEVYTDEEFVEMVNTYIEHEGEEPNDEWLKDKMSYTDVRNMWSSLKCEDIASDASKRWEAIKLIINPHVTHNCHGHVHIGE